MRECFVGETFVQKFKVTFDDDTGQTVDSGEFEITVNGEITQSGILAVDTDGRTMSFRFRPTEAGIHEIKLTWRVGDDVWVQPFLMKVITA